MENREILNIIKNKQQGEFKKIVIIYHHNCMDGIGGLACLLALTSSFRENYLEVGDDEFNLDVKKPITHIHNNVFAIPGFYGMKWEKDLEPYLDGNPMVIFVDFSVELDTLMKIENKSSALVVLDHHKTSKEVLGHLEDTESRKIIFDSSRSGAMIALNFITEMFKRNNISLTKGFINTIRYIQDRDLWKFELEDTKYFTEVFRFHGINLEGFYKVVDLVETNSFQHDGKIMLSYKEKQCKDIINSYLSKEFMINVVKDGESVFVPFINTNNAQFGSDIGNMVSEMDWNDSNCCICWNIGKDQRYVTFSIRSIEGCPISANEMVEKLGLDGGGHEHASGAKTELENWTDILQLSVVKKEEEENG